MARHDNDLLGMFATLPVGNDVVAFRFRQSLRSER